MTTIPAAQRDLVRTTLSVLAILALIVACFWVLRPFVPSLLWASTIVIATWRIMLAVERRLWGRRGLATAAMTLALLLVLVVPFALALVTLVDHAEEIAAWAGSVSAQTLPSPPGWVSRVPAVGEQLATAWHEIAEAGAQGLLARLAPYADRLVGWLLGRLGTATAVLFHFSLTVLVAAVLYVKGETAVAGVLRFARRLAGDQGEGAVLLAGQAIRGVALSVIVTALVQALLGGVGLAICGVPSVGILIAVMLVFGVAQLGPAPVLVPAVVWLYWRGDAGWGTALLVWTILVTLVDNVLRPMLVRRGADLPMALVFVGVVGGVVSLGVVGLFVGPVVLAVTYRLIGAWIDTEAPAATPVAAVPGAG